MTNNFSTTLCKYKLTRLSYRYIINVHFCLNLCSKDVTLFTISHDKTAKNNIRSINLVDLPKWLKFITWTRNSQAHG